MGYLAWRGPAGSLTRLVGYLGASRVTALHAFRRDFSLDATGSAVGAPNDFTHIGTAHEIDVVANAEAVGGKYLSFVGNNGDLHYLAWDTPGQGTDVEMLVQVRNQGLATGVQGAHFFLRATTALSYLAVRISADGNLAYFYGDGTTEWNDGNSAAVPGIVNDEVWWLRLQVIGTAFKVRAWKPTDPLYPAPDEPEAWTYERTISGAGLPTTGYVGIGGRESGTNRRDFGYVSVSPNPGTTPAPYPEGPTYVSLLATEEEIESWNARKTTGPFASSDDFDNSNALDDANPGEYDAIAAAYGTTWSTGRWAGPTELSAEGYVAKTTANDVSTTAREHAMDMLGVSFKCLMDDRASAGSGDTEATAIMTEIAAYAAIANLDFGDAALYPPGYYGDQAPLFGLCGWAGRLAVAYSNCAALVGTNATVEAWFSDLATLAEYELHDVLSGLWPQRKSNDYTTDRWDSIAYDGDTTFDIWGEQADGTDIEAIHVQRFFQNRRIEKAAFVLLAGALLDDATLIGEGERFLREWMGFGMNVTTTAHGDYDRDYQTTDLPQLGLLYHWSSWRNMMLAVDAAYRKGYTTAKTQTTSLGSTHATWGTQKNDKTLEECIAVMASWVDESLTTQVYTPANGGYEGVAAHRRCPVTPDPRMIYVDGWLVRAAAMFDRSDWRAAARRVGTPEGFRTLYQNDGGLDGARLGLWQRFLDPWDDRATVYG